MGEGGGEQRIPLSLLSPPPVPLLLTPATHSNTYSDENMGAQKGEGAGEGRGRKAHSPLPFSLPLPLSLFSLPPLTLLLTSLIHTLMKT